jgi:hypothetical protein
MCIVAPTSMAAALGWTISILRSTLDFDLLLFISNPPAWFERKGWVAQFIKFLNGIAQRRHHSQARNNPWTMFFYGENATKIVTAAPFRAQSRPPVSIPQGGRGAEISFLEGALTKAGLLSARR